MCFGIKEFALFIGLRSVGSVDKTRYARTENRFMTRYFKDSGRVCRSSVKKVFDARGWETDEDAVKFAKLFFLQNILLSSTYDYHVPKGDLDMIDSGDFDKFPWGKEVFTCTLESLKSAVRTTSKDNYYRLVGFPYAFQIWFYECCPYLNGRFCDMKAPGCIPRMLIWSGKYACKFEEVYRTLSLTASELLLRNVSPTEKEIEELQLEELFSSSTEAGNDNAIDADIVGHPPSLRGASTSSDQPQARMSQLEMENKITLLSSEVDGLKKMIFEMQSHFDLEFSKLRAIVDKQVHYGSTSDPLPQLNQVEVHVGDWDHWPQRKQNVTDEDVVVGNEVENEVVNEAVDQVVEGGHEVAEDGTGVPNVAVEGNEDATLSEEESIDLDRTMKMAAMINDGHDDGVHDENVNVNYDSFVRQSGLEAREPTSGLGVSTVAEVDTNVSVFDKMPAKDLDVLVSAAHVVIDAENENTPTVGTSTTTLLDKVTPAVTKRSLKLPVYFKSHFVQDFGSTSGKSSEGLNSLKGVSALDDNLG